MPGQFDGVWSTCYSRCILFVSTAMSCLDVLLNIIIWVYILVCVFLFLPHVCTVTEDQTKTVSGAHSPRFVFRFEKFYFVPVFVCKSAWEFGGIAASAASPLAASPHAHRSREISVAGGGSPKPAGSLPSSQVAAPPGVPFAGDHATGSPLTQCPPARLWLNARRPASVSKPAGLPLTQARRIAADSSPPDCRWLKPAGLPLTQAPWIGVDSCPLAASIPSPVDQVHMSRPGVPCVCLVVPTGTF